MQVAQPWSDPWEAQAVRGQPRGTMLGRWSTEQVMRPNVRGTVKLMRMMTKTTLRRTAGTAVNPRTGERSR